jgi:hypothetical protein
MKLLFMISTSDKSLLVHNNDTDFVLILYPEDWLNLLLLTVFCWSWDFLCI